MTVRQLVQHLTDTAPAGAEVLVRTTPREAEVGVAHAHVERRDGHLEPVVVVYLKPS